MHSAARARLQTRPGPLGSGKGSEVVTRRLTLSRYRRLPLHQPSLAPAEIPWTEKTYSWSFLHSCVSIRRHSTAGRHWPVVDTVRMSARQFCLVAYILSGPCDPEATPLAPGENRRSRSQHDGKFAFRDAETRARERGSERSFGRPTFPPLLAPPRRSTGSKAPPRQNIAVKVTAVPQGYTSCS